MIESNSAEDAYKAANEHTQTITSDVTYEGKDAEGKPARFKIAMSSSPGQEALFVIKQTLV